MRQQWLALKQPDESVGHVLVAQRPHVTGEPAQLGLRFPRGRRGLHVTRHLQPSRPHGALRARPANGRPRCPPDRKRRMQHARGGEDGRYPGANQRRAGAGNAAVRGRAVEQLQQGRLPLPRRRDHRPLVGAQPLIPADVVRRGLRSVSVLHRPLRTVLLQPHTRRRVARGGEPEMMHRAIRMHALPVPDGLVVVRQEGEPHQPEQEVVGKSGRAVGSVAIMRCHRRQQARQRAEMVGGRKQVARGQGAKVRLGGDAGTTQDVAR